jgi:hypothetical protein
MIKIILSSANMGNVDETDFDLWTAFVMERIGEALGLDDVDVDQHNFGASDDDEISADTEEQRDEIDRWLGAEGWDAFCGEEWTARRKAHEAA